MDNIKMWKDGSRLVIIIENCKQNTEEVISKMVGDLIKDSEIGLEPVKVETKPVLRMPIYVDRTCTQEGCFLYVPEGKLYLHNIRGIPQEADIIIKALNETTSKYEKSILEFQLRLKELMHEIIKNGDFQEVCIRYKDYFNGILKPLYCENMCTSFEEFISKFPETMIKDFILKRM